MRIASASFDEIPILMAEIFSKIAVELDASIEEFATDFVKVGS
jgi:hypothetical protein